MNDDDLKCDVDCYWSSLNRCYYCCYFHCCCNDGDDGRKCYLPNFRYGVSHLSDHSNLGILLMVWASFLADTCNRDVAACEVIWKEGEIDGR